jgi:predicted esterase
VAEGETRPALLILSCTGAIPHDIDSNVVVADSLGWILAACHGSRNHRSSDDNDRDIMNTVSKLLSNYPVDSRNIYICGFSGMGVQALYELVAHPDLVHGVVSACAPARPFPALTPGALSGRAAYLVTRKEDWNLEGNKQWKQYFERLGAVANLLITEGEHQPGDARELLVGCRWVYQNSE